MNDPAGSEDRKKQEVFTLRQEVSTRIQGRPLLRIFKQRQRSERKSIIPFMKQIAQLFLAFLLSHHTGFAQSSLPLAPSPESLGISSQAILDFVEAAERERKDEVHSFMLLRRGSIAAQGWWNPYKPESPHMLYSLSKSFTSTAIGIAQSEGLLSINDPVVKFFLDETPANASANLKAMRVRDLLRMTTGHNADPTFTMTRDTSDWAKAFLALPVEHKPGTHFVYNSVATFMLSAIIQKVSGKTLLEYLTPRLFEPLGITHPSWETAPKGINTGGWGLRIRTGDIARFGQLYLQQGAWNGKQLVPRTWVAEATAAQTSNGSNPESDWEQGYGYQFWRCRYNLYRGDGAFGQYCIVFPEQDAVLAITSGSKDMGAIMNLVWKHLLPAMKNESLPENGSSLRVLQAKLQTLALPVPEGKAKPQRDPSVSGKTYTLQPNPEGITAVQFNLASKTPSVRFTRSTGSYDLPVSYGSVIPGRYRAPIGPEEPAASAYAWTSGDTLLIRSYLHETPYYHEYKVVFSGKEVKIKREANVGFNPANRLELKGKID
jgi:CubicO group peptidase (beta-lactamase class C family)